MVLREGTQMFILKRSEILLLNLPALASRLVKHWLLMWEPQMQSEEPSYFDGMGVLPTLQHVPFGE